MDTDKALDVFEKGYREKATFIVLLHQAEAAERQAAALERIAAVLEKATDEYGIIHIMQDEP